jgi:predicted dehydrogenase
MNKPFRTLMVGLGARGKKWARILHEEPQCQTIGYVDLDESNLEWAQSMYEAQPNVCYKDMTTALEDLKPDFVMLATPPMDRYKDVLTVFEHGSHLLSEKPLCLDFDEGIKMVQAAEDARLGFTVGLNFRFQHCVLKAREILRNRLIGAPRFAGYSYWRNRDGYAPEFNKFPLTMRQPMLYEQTIHHIDEIRFVYDAEVERVSCRCYNPPWSMYREDATVTALFDMSAGLQVNYFGTWSGQTKLDQFLWRTDCDDGALFQYDLFSDLRIIRGSESDNMLEIPLPEQERLVDDARVMLSQILTQLSAGNLRPEPTAIDHLKTFGIIAACEESNNTGKPVEMDEFFDRHNLPPNWR